MFWANNYCYITTVYKQPTTQSSTQSVFIPDMTIENYRQDFHTINCVSTIQFQ